jgi:hypothetical protein
MTKSDYDFTKLPKWAQEYIKNIEREREMAIRTLNEFQDSDTPSSYWIEDNVCTGEEQGPTTKRHYVQANRVTVKVGKGEVDFYLRDGDLQISTGIHTLRFVPNASNSIRIEEPKR